MWEKQIRKLGSDFCRTYYVDRVISEVKRLPGFPGWSDDRCYREAWRRLLMYL